MNYEKEIVKALTKVCEKARQEGYNEGLKKVRSAIKDESYEQGYKKGYEDGDSNQRENSVYEYERGLSEAWEYARRIFNWTPYERSLVFGNKNCMNEHSASEAIAKIKEYEEK